MIPNMVRYQLKTTFKVLEPRLQYGEITGDYWRLLEFTRDY